ncbi:uncharacterized protein LOC127831379 isoform X1 [Dreissena polymorpha]|uniref:uncharacterized protein LOC127831379 isoform X1 n=1 Tax=Dreissena polymorpha TaxID=45954 RepID=UPI0022650244|nr:uncharacterized protein LOC127831379 isoform X1 [Dreissena polymorpha]
MPCTSAFPSRRQKTVLKKVNRLVRTQKWPFVFIGSTPRTPVPGTSSTDIGDVFTRDAIPASGQFSGLSTSNKKPRVGLKTVATIVKLSVSSKDFTKYGKQNHSRLTPDSQRRLTPDSQRAQKMRRSTFADISQISSGDIRRGSRQLRKTIGSTVSRETEKSRENSTLLNMAVREEIHRRHLMEKMRFIFNFSILLRRWWLRHSVNVVSQTHPFYQQFQMINESPQHGTPGDNAIDFKASYFKANKQRRMPQESVRILSMDPDQRTADEVYYAMIALRGNECFEDYPLRMQEALARHGMFQSFGSRRIIIKQGQSPVFFYFILHGTVVVATIETGEPYAKTRVTLRRGENFGELAIAQRIPRQSTVITMEYTEFLTIDCDTYENIFMAGGVKTLNDPDHNNFMKSLYFLKDWPIEILKDNTKAMKFCYFGRGKLMVKDSNTSEWIYIVKSGSLRVYKKLKKCYPTVNQRTGNHIMRAHVDGYHSFMSQESEYHRYAMYNNVNLPPPLCPDSEPEEDDDDDDLDYCYSFKGTHEEKENLLALPLMQRVERLIRPRTAEGGVLATYGQSKHATVGRQRAAASAKEARRRPVLRPALVKNPSPRTTSSVSNVTSDISIEVSSATPDMADGKRTLVDDFEKASRLKNAEHEKRLQTPDGKPSPRLRPNADVNPHALSTRHNVFVTDVKREMTEADKDPEFVLIQTLTKGQAFGIQQVLIESQPSLTLVSAGAECILLNKKFFKEHVDPNMLQKLKSQVSPYPSDQELQTNLQTRVNWLRFRKITLNNLMAERNDGRPQRLKPKRKVFAFH